MATIREIHPDFLQHLQYKNEELVELYLKLRVYIFSIFPMCNELLYHTHALTSLYSVSQKMSDGFCMIPIYTDHFNLGFNLGALLEDTHQILHGTGKLIRHIPIRSESEFQNPQVKALLEEAQMMALEESNETLNQGLTISKIKS